MRAFRTLFLASCVAASASAWAAEEQGGKFAFALIGDVPYSEAEVESFRRMTAALNAEDLAWAVHIGDIQKGGGGCPDAMYESRLALFNAIAVPVVYTPGDNDWADCAETGEDALERLAYLRAHFFPSPRGTIGGASMAVTSQAAEPEWKDFAENVRWTKNNVVFATLHSIKLPAGAGPQEKHPYMQAMQAWVKETVDVAVESDAAAIFFATHVNPWPKTGFAIPIRPEDAKRFNLPEGTTSYPVPDSPLPAMAPFYDMFFDAARRFHKPILLAVGNTHYFRIDQPLRPFGTNTRSIETFTRVESFGSPYAHWVKIMVDPSDPDVFHSRRG